MAVTRVRETPPRVAARGSLGLALLLTACSSSTTRPDPDAFIISVDSDVQDAALGERDATVHDTPTRDASESDAWMSEPDAFELPDAFLQEACDGLDDDGDFNVDEGAACAGGIPCIDGRCECAAGTYDCNPEPGCESFEGRLHCGGCGVACGALEGCELEDGPPHCVRAGITDFTAAFEDSGITCIVRYAGRPDILCRGLNTDHAISDDAPETAVLDWTEVPLWGFETQVRAWGHLREDGVRTMTLCALTSEALYCRGSNATGLVFGPSVPTAPGWHLILRLPRRADYDRPFSIEGGEGILFYPGLFPAVIWGGPTAAGRVRELSEGGSEFGDGARRFIAEPVFPQRLFTWGPAVPALSLEPWSDSPVPELRVVDDTSWPGLPRDRAIRGLSCYRNYCCLMSGPSFSDVDRLECWGGSDSSPRRERIDLTGIPVTGIDVRSKLRLFPSPTGVQMCIEDYCLPLANLHDGPSARIPTLRVPLVNPDISRPAQTRPDWRADCAREHDTTNFHCIGMHSGWPIP